MPVYSVDFEHFWPMLHTQVGVVSHKRLLVDGDTQIGMSRPTGGVRDRSVTVSSVGARPRKSSLTPKPRKTITSNRRKSTGSSIPAMDRYTMMIMEANEISAYLQKEYVSISITFRQDGFYLVCRNVVPVTMTVWYVR